MTSLRSRRRLALLVALLLPAAQPARLAAHEGPEHEIEELSELIHGIGESPGLLIERAIEYSVLRKYPEAKRDLERAIQLDPGSLHALRELGRIQFVTDDTETAIATVTRALRVPIEDPIDRGGLLILRAEFHRSKGRFRPALADCDAAIRLHKKNPEWYLLRSDLQRRLQQHRRRLAGIEEGLTQTGAGVLAIERVEALLDDHQYRAALTLIEPHLESVRLQGSWLVRRGRARIGLGQQEAGEGDLRTALTQLQRQLDPTRPDATVLLDQAVAYALLKDNAAVKQCHQLARDKGGDPDITERIHALLATEKPLSSKGHRSG